MLSLVALTAAYQAPVVSHLASSRSAFVGVTPAVPEAAAARTSIESLPSYVPSSLHPLSAASHASSSERFIVRNSHTRLRPLPIEPRRSEVPAAAASRGTSLIAFCAEMQCTLYSAGWMSAPALIGGSPSSKSSQLWK